MFFDIIPLGVCRKLLRNCIVLNIIQQSAVNIKRAKNIEFLYFLKL